VQYVEEKLRGLMMNSKSYQTNHYIILSLIFLAINTILYQKLGIKIANDSPRYLEYSNLIINKNIFYKAHDFWYLSYVLFITIVKLFTDNCLYIVLLQIILSWLSIVAIYKSSFLLFNENAIAFATSIAYLTFIEISSWNFYVLTESFYSSMMCIAIYLVIRTHLNPTYKNLILCFIACLITFFTKPTGISIGIAIGALLLYQHKNVILKAPKSLIITSSIVLVSISYLLINSMLQSFILIENYLLGEIVYGITTLPGFPSMDMLTIDVDMASITVPDKSHSPIIRNFLFFIQNPIFYTKLASLKLFWFLAHIKPYFSLIHNVFIALLLYPMYLFFGISLSENTVDKSIKLFLSSIIIVNCLIVSLTSEDWDGRFLMPILPALFLLGTGQFVLFVRKRIPSL
jgi:hypothetical protein